MNNKYFSGCPRTINSLPAEVPEPMTCYIPDYCTGIDCCAELPVLGLGLRSYVFLDLERLEIRYGMENVHRTVKIADYTWGKLWYVWLYDLHHYRMMNTGNLSILMRPWFFIIFSYQDKKRKYLLLEISSNWGNFKRMLKVDTVPCD